MTTAAIVVIASNRLFHLRRSIAEVRSIGRYELERRIGKGGMGEVWAAWHRGLERKVALKILRLGESTDPLAVARFEREVRLSSGLTHPNTVRVCDSGSTEDGLLYYAMELLDGTSLGELVKREGPLPPARAVHLVTQAAHGRAPAVGIGHKTANPDSIVICYQGDGDLASIGLAEIISAAQLGMPMTMIFVNNAIFGMTGGQMAPTTLIGQRTTTTPGGRDAALTGYPMRMSEMLAQIPGATYVERVSVHSPVYVRKAKKAIRRAFEVQVAGQGFSLVEVLSSCPTNWGLEPAAALDWIKDAMIPIYPLGVLRTPDDPPAYLTAVQPQSDGGAVAGSGMPPATGVVSGNSSGAVPKEGEGSAD